MEQPPPISGAIFRHLAPPHPPQPMFAKNKHIPRGRTLGVS